MVNLPTVPGDVLAGAAAAICAAARAGAIDDGRIDAAIRAAFLASLASAFFYLFGLADNDIVGAKTDRDRPIPDGEISLAAARIARGLCLLAALVVGAVGDLPPEWWIVALALVLTAVVYNRTKFFFFMGLCRGLDVCCGAALVYGTCGPSLEALAVAVVWTLAVAAVTKYSEGEETDPAKKRFVGMLVGAIIYLQLAVLLTFQVRPFLLAGAGLLVLLRLLKSRLPEVSAS